MSLWSEIKQALKVAVCAAIILGIPTVIFLSCIEDCTKKQEIKPQPIEAPATTAREEIVTGMCTFGDCPVVVTKNETTETNLTNQLENITNAETVEYQGLTDNEPAETPSTSQNYESTYQSGYIGTFWITGYTAEEGFPEGSATASGYGVRPGYCAMNAEQRRSLGIRYGDQIYVDGLGTYTVMDSGCGWGVVDIWLYTNSEAYSITGTYDVYLI